MNFKSQIGFHGELATVYTAEQTGTSDFGEVQTDFVEERTVKCIRTYQNRNEIRSTGAGEYVQDNPVFIFPPNESPASGDRIEYDGAMYELRSPTAYDTHVAIFGKPVQ